MNVNPCEPMPFIGMRLIEMKMIPVNKIVGKNVGRATDAQVKKISSFVRLIKQGLYKPFYNPPPTVTQNEDGTFKLNNGFHRLRAHIGADKEEMWCAVVEFDNESIADMYSSVSNLGAEDEELYVKTDRTDEDVVKIAKKVMQDNNSAPTKENVVKVLKELKATNRTAYKNGSLVKEILKSFNVKVETITAYDKKNGLIKYREIVDDSTVESVEFSSTKHDSRESHVRALRNCFTLSKRTDTPVSVLVSVNGASTAEEIRRVRQQYKAKLLKEVRYYEELVDSLRDGSFNIPKIVYLPQSEKEIESNKLVV